MTRFLAAILFGATALGPAALAQTSPPATPGTASSSSCKDLVNFLEHRGSAQPASPVTLDQAKTFERSNNTAECRNAIGRIQSAGIKVPANLAATTTAAASQTNAGARVTVQQPAPQVTVKQASPQVTVQQAQPQVTVRQPQPEITVHQPAPTITVQIPQPEITVRMPAPQVSVAMAQPKVAVNEAKPQVNVVQPAQQPNVQVQQAEAAQPNVKVVQEASGQPQVKYERDQANVVVQQPAGQPQVKFESAAATPAGANPNPATPEQSGQTAAANGGAASPATPEQPGQTAAANGNGEAAPPSAANPAPSAAASGATQPMDVSSIDNKKVFDGQGHELGDIKHVVQNENGQKFIVLAQGGFLGIGQKQVTLPLDSIHLQGDRFVAQGMTDDQIKAMPAWDQNAQSSYKVLDGNQSVVVAEAQ